jgi:hypothetical protein
MAKSDQKSDPSAPDVAAEPSVPTVTLKAARTFLDSLNGKTVQEGDQYETSVTRAAELIAMGCLAKPE